jgi:hypothetical protein
VVVIKTVLLWLSVVVVVNKMAAAVTVVIKTG